MRKDREVLNQKVELDILKEKILTKSKGERFLHTKKIPVLDENGAPLYLLGISEDITEKTKAEDALRENEEKFAKVFHTSPSIISVSRASDGMIVDVNEAFTVATGFAREEAVGKSALSLNLWVDPEERKRIVQAIEAGVDVSNKEVKFRKKNGETIESLLTARSISIGGKPFMLLSVLDITERKKMEKQLADAYLGLEEKVKERTRELKEAQEKIVRSEKLAIVGQLASSVAHELRNPLGVMKNAVYYMNMLEPCKENSDIKENLQLFSSEIENSDKIISDLLEFSRIKHPDLKLHQINSIVNEAIARLKLPPDISVTTELDEKLPLIPVDALQMQQVFFNLAVNAVQSIEGKGSVIIRSKAKDGRVEISFADTGAGISKEHLPKIFEPLFSTKAKGTGLGLPVVASIIEGHRGNIEVTSEQGKGSTFTVILTVGEVADGRKN